MVLIAVFVVLVFVYSLVSQRLGRTVITAPMLFTAAGAATILLPEVARAVTRVDSCQYARESSLDTRRVTGHTYDYV
jgi:hypothetical protein